MELEFIDYQLDRSDMFPTYGGIYCVFSDVNGKLIYIGQATNIRNRIQNHEQWNDFSKHQTGDHLATTYANLKLEWRDKVEGRLIKANRPPENKQIPEATLHSALDLRGYVWGVK